MRTVTQQRGHLMAMQQMHGAKEMEEMGCDARGEGDGGDGLQCTGRFRGKLADLGKLGILEFREIGISKSGQTR
ncbi:hypothetical protein PVK06_048057 [Gossypium arboreum]|uniref:Uncharacterized protein n=1 Tax=Gossypium arboreum TaxID=29729 RepID=A0ABR0MFE3_GOSAR|nr:hypothetical protein PVK06_048057 [Gossypium arboreum]